MVLIEFRGEVVTDALGLFVVLSRHITQSSESNSASAILLLISASRCLKDLDVLLIIVILLDRVLLRRAKVQLERH